MSNHLSDRPSGRWTRLLRATLPLLTSAAAWLTPVASAGAQYFGRNKVQYDRFDFRIVRTPHYDIHFYPAESLATADASRMAERWYARHVALLHQEYSSNPLIFYSDPPDFQQTNVIEGFIGQGTGGVTEGARERVIMPFTGSYAETDHVLGHELVHVTQYRIALGTRGGLSNLNRVPLWVIEGMAEYLSVGRSDPNTAMWLRDALRRRNLPTMDQLTRDPRFFPYRYGQAVWAYIGGRFGDEAVNELYRAALAGGWDNAVRTVLRTTSDSLSAQWHAAIRSEYGPELTRRVAPDSVGRPLVIAEREGDQNVSPSVSPDGRHVAFFSSRGLFGMDLYIAEVATGRVIKQLTSVTANAHFEALSFISSAGTWSPDGRRLAAVVYADGDNEINIFNVDSRRIERRIKPRGLGAMSDPAWSPDGRQIAFSGMKGGISDLYLFDLTSGNTTQLTDDREAQIHPAWSPDGRRLAFVTDAGDETNLQRLSFGKMRLALLELETRRVQLLPRLGSGKAINPQFSADAASLYFVSDQDGVSDIYRMALASEEVRRVTRLATGVSGITALSPTLSVAQQSGDLVFSVFDRQGFAIRRLPATEAVGVSALPTVGVAPAGVLPPVQALETSLVSRSLRDAEGGLPNVAPAGVQRYRSSIGLDYVGGATIGATFGGVYGTGPTGGVAFGFSDMLGNHIVSTVVQAQGTFKDFGGQAMYLNRTRRMNWGVQGYHVPALGVFATYENTTFNVDGQQVPGTIYTQVLQRVYYQNLGLLAQYPLSTTRRVEWSAGVQRIAFDLEVDSFYVAGSNFLLRETRDELPTEPALTFGTASLALVGDNSFFGFTSPVAGGRYRFEASPFIGSLNYQNLLADYRRYLFVSPLTLAFRALHYGRYGADAESDRLYPLFVGYPSLMRGYDAESFDPNECSQGAPNAGGCPVFNRLEGSRVAVANVELRIPLIGNERFGILKIPFLPTEIAPFADAGMAWSSGDSPDIRFDRNTTDRVPVFSTGISARVNLLGFAVVELYWVNPYQRPGRGRYFGFQLAPGW